VALLAIAAPPSVRAVDDQTSPQTPPVQPASPPDAEDDTTINPA
jgi:hypothetical protein